MQIQQIVRVSDQGVARPYSVTKIVIAHRLSTVRTADRIYVLDHGRVAEEGTFDELMAKGGLFAISSRSGRCNATCAELRNTMVALRGAIHVACFIIHVLIQGVWRCLSEDVDVTEHATLLFCSGEVATKGAESESDVREKRVWEAEARDS